MKIKGSQRKGFGPAFHCLAGMYEGTYKAIAVTMASALVKVFGISV